MIVLAVLKCKRHPKYKAQREPKSCPTCIDIWCVVDLVKKVSKHYQLRYTADETFPVIQS